MKSIAWVNMCVKTFWLYGTETLLGVLKKTKEQIIGLHNRVGQQ